MNTSQSQITGVGSQLWHFVLHLRWHYQLFILSGGFLLGGFLSSELNEGWFIVQFLNVHLLLFGGATAYNSFWDRDKGPVGGLKNPPKMKPWMWLGSLLLQMVGLLLAIPKGSLFVSVYAFSMLLFWLYSTPLARWKSRPIKSLFAIGLSTGFSSVMLGYLAAGNTTVPFSIWIAALGVTFMLLSLYPVSQVYQKDEDLRRGDQTFALQYGREGVKRFFVIAFFVGLSFVTLAISFSHLKLAAFFGVIGLLCGAYVRSRINGLTNSAEEYQNVMRLKYGTSMAFVLFLISVVVLKHTAIAEMVSLTAFLLE